MADKFERHFWVYTCDNNLVAQVAFTTQVVYLTDHMLSGAYVMYKGQEIGRVGSGLPITKGNLEIQVRRVDQQADIKMEEEVDKIRQELNELWAELRKLNERFSRHTHHAEIQYVQSD